MDEAPAKARREPAAPDSRSDPSAARAAGATVALDRYVIHPDRSLAAFETPAAHAFAADDTKGARGSLIALVSPSRAPVRLDILPSLRSTDCPFLMRPYRWGVVDWPAAGQRRFAIIYGQPGEERLVPSLEGPYPALSESVLVERVIRPVLSALSDLAARGIPHRALRPDNLYVGYTEGRQVVLGDAAIAPAGSTNPVMFETIENGMTNPMGRGPGTIGDDLYALGATLLCLAMGHYPAQGVDDRTLLYNKIGKGSYAALAGSARLPSGLREVTRGLLADDPKQRWTLQDLALWLDGRRLSPIQPTVPDRAQRPYLCAGREHFACRPLALTMAEDWSAAAKALAEADLEGWVRKSVGDQARANALTEAISWAARPSVAAGQSGESALLARLCTALDPTGPLRYKNLSTVVQGLGPLLFDLMRDPNGAQPFAHLIASELPAHWIGTRYGDGLEARALVGTVDRLRAYLKNHAPGFGIERCLYELNPSLPCLSSLVESRYVMTPEDLLRELESMAGSGRTDAFPIDRHIAAFVAARFGRGTDDHFALMGDRSDKAKAALGALRALAVLQWTLGGAQLPALSAWMGRLSGPIIDAYHSKALRARLHEQLGRVARSGSLSELLNLVDDAQLRARDEQAYRDAVRQVAMIDAETDRLSNRSGQRRQEAEAIGSKLAAGLAMAIAAGAAGIVGMVTFL
jgi:hypothetical protein